METYTSLVQDLLTKLAYAWHTETAFVLKV